MTEQAAIELWGNILTELRAKGLAVPDIRFGFDGSRRRFGACRWTRAMGQITSIRITISKHLLALNGPDEVGKTMRHEIAHALAGHKAGHNWQWQQVDRQCGGDGRRCYSATVAKPDLPWRATCPKCGITHQKTRPPKRALWCKCNGRTFRPEEALAFRMAETAKAARNADPVVEKVLAMRRAGMGFVAIDAAYGIHGKKGWWSWKIVKQNA